MPNALLTGVSGLRSHQRMLDIVGHNIANANTVGFKSQRGLFSDLFYETIRPFSGSSEDKGGTNPNQIGGGVQLAQTDRNFAQGSLEATGEQFNFALAGNGFFVVNNGISDVYTRSGVFTLDDSATIVDPLGLRLQRLPGPGEPDGVNPGFQIPGDSSIRVPFGATVAGIITTDVVLTGNLSAANTWLQTEVMTSSTPFEAGGVPATLATALDALDSNTAAYVAGDQIRISGKDTTGFDVNTTINANGANLGDIITAINSTFTGITATLDGAGNIVATANQPGVTSFNLIIADVFGNTGATDFSAHLSTVTTEGADTGTELIDITIYDDRGGAHEIGLLFEKQADDIWQLTTQIDPTSGIAIDGVVDNIVFNDDGTFLGSGDPTVVFQINGIAQPQNVTIGFSDPESLETLSHFASKTAVKKSQNGVEPGSLVAANIELDGTISGVASNGRTLTIAQIAVADFENMKGLSAIGDGLFQQTLNSGIANLGVAGSGGRGDIRGGQLEASNVDMALEFTRLIIAQRGFSANARTITVADEMLEELTSIVR